MAGLISKASLTTGRAIQYPFAIPKRLDQSALLVGKSMNGMVAGINGAIAGSFAALQPRHGAQHLMKLFVKVDEATKKSDAIAQRNHDVFWGPMGEGFDKVGTALGSPFAYYYAKKEGFPEPSNPELLSALLHSSFRVFPGPGGGQQQAGPPPEQQQAAPQEAAPQEGQAA